ncbi:MAG: HAD-IIIA family hydrolase [Candidatus Aenigmarchaeota archaeon]|nr:HAD-IIIA family hydrolase [Candidatus Aenigmarchaeota archaeon]
MKKVIKYIFFDLDNTLVDFMGIKKMCCSAAVDAMIKEGLEMSKKDAMKILFELYENYGIEYDKIFQKFLIRVMKKIDYKILARAVYEYRRVQLRHLKPYPGVVHLMKKLKQEGYKLSIVSDAPSMKVWLRLFETGLAEYFDFVVAFDETRQKKPSRGVFRLAVKKAGCKPHEILFVGDDPMRDVNGAKAVGIKTVFALYGLVPKYKKYVKSISPDYVIRRPSELLDVLKRINGG